MQKEILFVSARASLQKCNHQLDRN